MRAPRRLIVTIAAGALAVAGGSTLAHAHGGGNGGNAGELHGQPQGNNDRGRHDGIAASGA
jgi:hypothetical protein